jgi:hypothetical protein
VDDFNAATNGVATKEFTNVIRRFFLGEIPADRTVARRRDLVLPLFLELRYEKPLDAEV